MILTGTEAIWERHGGGGRIGSTRRSFLQTCSKDGLDDDAGMESKDRSNQSLVIGLTDVEVRGETMRRLL